MVLCFHCILKHVTFWVHMKNNVLPFKPLSLLYDLINLDQGQKLTL